MTPSISLTLDKLDSHLFKCADIIRDAVDSTDYKEYILLLVFYRAISEESEKDYEENVEEYARRPNGIPPSWESIFTG